MTSTISSPLRILAIGANPKGRGGEWIHRILTLSNEWELCGVVDSLECTRQYWGSKGRPAFSSLEQALSATQPQAVVVAVPPAFTAGIQTICAQQGIAILAEKPLAVSLPELARLQDNYQKHPVPLVVGVQRRSHPTYAFLRSVIRKADNPPSELAVRIVLGRSTEETPDGHRADPALAGGGILLDLGYHALDLAQFLLEYPIEPVSCTLSTLNDLAPHLEYSAHLLGRAGTTWVRIIIERCGEKSELVQAKFPEGVWQADREFVTSPEGSVDFTTSRTWDQAETGCLEQLARHIKNGTSNSEDLWDHLAILEIIEHAYAIARRLGLEPQLS
jgi:predicted dehydrogenase